MRRPDEISPRALAASAADILQQLRARGPRVHCITNTVAQNFTANVLLALGCLPSMTQSAGEIGDFVAGSDALLVNLGTFDRERREASEIAADTARRANVPWVLDPVFVDRSAPRASFARVLIGRGPQALRLNRAEFAALAGVEATPDVLLAYAGDKSLTVGLSGEADWVADSERLATISNGHALMAKVTAMGCAGSALNAACLAVEPDTWRATAAALIIIGVAGEVAAARAAGPGSFAVAILDALYNLDASTLIAHAKVT